MPDPGRTEAPRSGFERARAAVRGALARLPGANSQEPAERWRKETRRHPDRAPGWSALAEHLAAAGREDEALDACRRAIALDPTFAHPWNLQAVLEARRGRLEDGLQSSRKAVELDPTFGGAWANLSVIYSLLGREPEAAEAARQAATHGTRLSPAPPPAPTRPSGTGPGTRPVDQVWGDNA